MTNLACESLTAALDEKRIQTFQFLVNEAARKKLAEIWEEDAEALSNFLAIFFDKKIKLDKVELVNLSFVTLAFKKHGYVPLSGDEIDTEELEKQYKIDLDIINREAGWDSENAIFFHSWWPKPSLDKDSKTLQFGIVLSDSKGNVINKTLNRLILTRFGHVELNYSFSEELSKKAETVDNYLSQLDEISNALKLNKGYRYEDVDQNIDSPSRSKLSNLILSAELF